MDGSGHLAVGASKWNLADFAKTLCTQIWWAQLLLIYRRPGNVLGCFYTTPRSKGLIKSTANFNLIGIPRVKIQLFENYEQSA